MKLYFITSKMNFEKAGGSVEEFDLMTRTLMQLGTEVVCVTMFSGGNKLTRALPYKVIEEQVSGSGLLAIQRGVLRVMRKYEKNADFFYIDGHNFLYGAGLYRRLGGSVPVTAYFNRELVSWPDDYDPYGLSKSQESLFAKIKKKARYIIEKYYMTWMASGIDLFLYTNPFLEKNYVKFGVRKDKCTLLIGDPTDVENVLKEAGDTKGSYKLRNKQQPPITLFFTSRMIAGKGFDLLLTAFSKLKNKENFKLVLGGSGYDEERLHALAKSLELEKYVEFTGWLSREDLLKRHMEADIFVQARWRSDMSSMSLSYAMVFGLPMIVPGGGGLQWVTKDAALTFKDGDADDLARKIEELGSDPKLREQLSENSYKRVSDDEIYYKKTMQRWNDAMLQIIARRSSL